MKGQDRIEELFAFVLVDSDGTEGIPAVCFGDIILPMTGADWTRALAFMPLAKTMAGERGKSIELVRFTHREHADWIDP